MSDGDELASTRDKREARERDDGGNERRARALFRFLSCSHHSLRPLFP